MIKAILIACLFAGSVFGQAFRGGMMSDAYVAAWARATRADVGVGPFTVTFLTGTTPTNIVLGAAYAEPDDPSLALYDSGDGVWHEYTSKTIPVVGDYVAFKGDWRDSLGRYYYMFGYSFQSTDYTCKFSGMLDTKPDVVANVYREIFRDNTAVTAIEDNPLPILSGAPAVLMYYAAFRDMSNVEGALPAGFMDTRNLTGAPAERMLEQACLGMSSVTSLPEGFMDTSGLTGAPANDMFLNACLNMSSVTSLPAGFMDTRNLTGAPAVRMFLNACLNMSSVTNAYTFKLGAGITFDATNVVGTLDNAFRNMPQWGGQVMWGTNVLVEAIPVPDSRTRTFLDSTNMPNYEIIDDNWK